jgi:hypothetical protein
MESGKYIEGQGCTEMVRRGLLFTGNAWERICHKENPLSRKKKEAAMFRHCFIHLNHFRWKAISFG